MKERFPKLEIALKLTLMMYCLLILEYKYKRTQSHKPRGRNKIYIPFYFIKEKNG